MELSKEPELWKRLKEYHDKSCEEMEAKPNSDEYWKNLEEKEKWEEKLK